MENNKTNTSAGAAAQASHNQQQMSASQMSQLTEIHPRSSGEQTYSTVQPDQQQQQQQYESSGSDAFDLSNYDPLQAHALQLTASAGFNSIVQPIAPSPGQDSAQPTVSDTTEPAQPQMYYFPAQQQQQQPILAYAPGPVPMVTPGNVAQNLNQPMYITAMAPQPSTGVPHPQPYYTTSVSTMQVGQNPASISSSHPVAPHPGGTDGSNPVTGDKRPYPSTSQQEVAPKRQQIVYFAPATNMIDGYTQSVKSSNSTVNEEDIDPILRKPPDNWDTMTAEEKRRHERNVREQQRSFKISQQIKELRQVLTESCIPFKPNKFSILMSVVDYIKELQSRAIMLDAEHHKLANTINVTKEMVNSGQPIPSDEEESLKIEDDTEMLFVQGLDYKDIFQQCSAALGVAALDGRILACNEEFASVTGLPRAELLRQSVFNLMRNHDEVFRAMGEMLSSTDGIEQSTPRPSMYWSGVVNQQNQNTHRQRLHSMRY